MNDLEKYFTKNQGREIRKWMHYFDIYEKHFARFRNKKVHVLEFGVSHGGSLQMWKNYFGNDCQVYGVDVMDRCKSLEEERIKIFIGDQGDRAFLKSLISQLPRIDILIDDGGHQMVQQINTFEEVWPSISNSGVYICEDTFSSYRPKYGGGYNKNGTFIKYTKNLIDQLNAWNVGQNQKLPVTDFTRSAYSIHYYFGAVVIEKNINESVAKNYRPKITGNPSW